MSKPISDYALGKPVEDRIRASVEELISAESALNMEPRPIPDKGTMGYLSETDLWVAHAYEHIAAAIDILSDRPYKLRRPGNEL